MQLLSFTNRSGSLLHPIIMSILLIGWVSTWILGILVRKNRTARLEQETTPLLNSQIDPILNAPHGKLRKMRAHHKLSAALIASTIWIMLLGMFNTFSRSGRLFPGPHLYGGLLFIGISSINVATVPWLGTTSVRNIHAIVGLLSMVVLASQLKSGIPILVSVWKTVKW